MKYHLSRIIIKQSEVKHLYSKIYFNSQVQIEICTRTPNIC